MSRPADALSRLRGDQRGVAAVEFALILPFLLLLYFGTIETSSLYVVDRRVTTVAGTIGDLVSQANGQLPSADLTDYFEAAERIMQPYSSEGLNQVVSLLQVASDGTVTVKWSRASPGSTPRLANAPFPLAATSQFNVLARRHGWLVAAEASYAYLPVYGVVISNAINLSRTEYFLPRYEDEIELD